MSLDCKAGSKLVEFCGTLDIEDTISLFTFKSINLDLIRIIQENYNEIYTEIKDNATWDTYEYSRLSIEKLKKLNEDNKYGEDFTRFLNDLLETSHDTFYLAIF